MRYLVVIAVLILPAMIASAQSEPLSEPAGKVEIFLAKDDGTGHVGEPATSFQTTDSRIYCIVQLPSSTPATVKMHFVAVSVPGVKPDTRVVTTSYTTKDGEDTVNFHGKPKTSWIAGKYRVEIFVDGKVVKDVSFDITGPRSFTGSSFIAPTTKLKQGPIIIGKPKKNQE